MAQRATKTVSVEYLRGLTNYYLAEGSKPDAREARHAVATLYESAALKTGNYEGFSYLPSSGIDFSQESPCDVEGFDDSRRMYHVGEGAR